MVVNLRVNGKFKLSRNLLKCGHFQQLFLKFPKLDMISLSLALLTTYFVTLQKVDLLLFGEFKAWKEEPTIDKTCCFLDRIYKEDIYPCLTFSKNEVRNSTI